MPEPFSKQSNSIPRACSTWQAAMPDEPAPMMHTWATLRASLAERERVPADAGRELERQLAVLHARQVNEPVEALAGDAEAAAADVVPRLVVGDRPAVEQHADTARPPVVGAEHQEHLARREARVQLGGRD